jgi:calcineurin-like phosphoesterase family protein
VSVHGHIHNATREDRKLGPLGINCSVEAIDYRPKTLRELLTPKLFENLARE